MAEEIKQEQTGQDEPQNVPKTYTEEEYTALQAQLAEMQKQLTDATAAIKSYTDMDIEGIKKSAADWQQKAEQLEAEQKAKAYSDSLDQFVAAQGMKNEIYAAHLKRQLEEAGLNFDQDGTLVGGGDIVKKLRATCPDAFADDKPKPQFAASTPGDTHKTPDDAFIRKLMGLK